MYEKKKTIIIIISAIIALVFLFVLFSALKGINKGSSDNDREIADSVIADIETINSSFITLEHEHTIMYIKAEYDKLTEKQKGMVSNYKVLEKALADLQYLKDKAVADQLVFEINSVNVNTLTAENTSIALLFEKYNNLTEAQKGLVTNYNLLVGYKETVDEEIAKAEKKNAGRLLAENFESFEGKWGDFGSHINKYQGMIEEVIRKDINYKERFSTVVNSLDFRVSRFEKDTTIFGIGISYFSFKGLDKEENPLTLFGEIVIKENGSLYAVINGEY